LPADLPFLHCRIPSKIKDIKKMLVADLKSELKARGASVLGKKADLVERLLEIIEKEKSSSAASRSTITPQSGFGGALQKLDMALSEKNFQLFEETMKEMETAIRSNSGLFLTAEQKNFVFSKLRVWREMDGIPSESIATVLKSAGYLGLSLLTGDQTTRILANSIIDKYLKQDSKSTRSIAIFSTALNKVGAKWKRIEPQTQDRILILLEMLIEAEDLDQRSFSESLMGWTLFGIKWGSIPITVREKYIAHVNKIKTTLDVSACHVLVRSFSKLLSDNNIGRPKEEEDIHVLISEISLEGLKLIAAGSLSTPDSAGVANV
jgi:hypothetical protein